MPMGFAEYHANQDGGQLRVLVVEDDADSAQTIAELLRLYGHEADIAVDGPTAVLAAESNPPDVILLDIGLPGMDGWQVARLVQEQAVEKTPFLVALTGYRQEADRQRSQAAGIHLHLTKPVDPEQLKALLERFQAVVFG
jgi:CheY-like chemotaxis protein